MIRGMVQFPGAGCIVECMQGNAPQIAWVLEEHDGKLRLLLPNRREITMQATRLLPWSGPAFGSTSSRDAAIELLNKHGEARSRLTAELDMLELWSMSQGDVERAPAIWFAELAQSDPDIDAVAAYGHALLECKTHFKFQPPDFEILPEALVAARLAEHELTRTREDMARQGSAWFAALWDLFQKRRTGKATNSTTLDVPLPAPAVEQQLRDLLMHRLAEPERTDDDSLWRMLTKSLTEDPLLPLYLAETWGLVPAHYNFWILRADYAPGDDWALQHSSTIEALISSSNATDAPISAHPFVSIDSATTRDIDDALYVSPRPDGGWTLHLALACPALDWPFGSELDKEVQHRATSLYLPEATHHMLPERLGIAAYTLTAKQPRPALTLHCEIGPDGSVHSCTPALERVVLADNLTYQAVETVLAPETPQPECPPEDTTKAAPHADTLRAAHALAVAYQAARLRRGAVIIDRPDIEVCLIPKAGPEAAPEAASETGTETGPKTGLEEVEVLLKEEPETPCAHLLVSELMILANAALARWAQDQGCALLHRTQDVTVPKDFVGVWQRPQDIARVVRILTPASLETNARPHAGLGEEAYAPSTSPLRRYPDLINEAQILHMLRHGSPRWSKSELDAMLPALHARLEAAGIVQRQRPRYWKLLYVRRQGDKCWWPGIVTDVNDTFVFVSLPRERLFVRARRNLFGERCHAGQEIEIRLHKVVPLKNDISVVESRELA